MSRHDPRSAADGASQGRSSFRDPAAEVEAVVSAGSDERLRFWNLGAQRIFGYREAEVLGEPVGILIAPASQASLREEIDRLCAGAAPHATGKTLDLRGVRKNGLEFPLELTPSTWHSGPERFFTFGLCDASARLRQRERSREATEKYREILESIEEGYFEVDLAGNLTFFNSALMRILGYPPNELLGKNNRQFSDRENAEKMFAACNRVYRTGTPESALSWDVVRKDGERRHVETSITLLGDLLGPAGFRGIVRDVTERIENELALRQSELQLAEAQRIAHVGSWEWDVATDAVTWSDELYRIYGLEPRQLVPTHEGFLSRVHADDREKVRAAIGEALVACSPFSFEHRIVQSGGAVRTLQARGQVNVGDDGKPATMNGTGQDITERASAAEEIKKGLSLLQATLESTADGLMVVDQEGRIVSFNQRFAQMWRMPESVLESRDDSEVLRYVLTQLRSPDRFLDRVMQLYAQPEEESFDVFELEDGRVLERYSIPHRLEGAAIGRVWSFRDATARRRAEEQLEYQAYHDPLTGLPNRLLFRDRLTVALSRARLAAHHPAVLFVDLDAFRRINDSLGHGGGDRILREVATRLRAAIGEEDTLARLGGDEFALLVGAIEGPGDAARFSQRILETIARRFVVDGQDFYLTASIGIAFFPGDGRDADTLIKNASDAMMRAKGMGKNTYQLCTEEMNKQAFERMALEQRLRGALLGDEFLLHYQPVLDLRTETIVGTEALVRWRSNGGMDLLHPSHFIPVAEDSRLIVPLGAWVLRTACQQGRRWHDGSFPRLRMAVNLSARQFEHPDLTRTVEEALGTSGFPPESLELEITETVAMRNAETTIGVLRNFQAMGVKTSIDDFGTGQSSLSYLKHFPISSVKIDQSFVRDIGVDPDDEAIASAVIAMAHKLRLRVIAEGVETEAQLAFLKAHDCDEVQGFLLSRPLSSEDFDRTMPMLRRGV